MLLSKSLLFYTNITCQMSKQLSGIIKIVPHKIRMLNAQNVDIKKIIEKIVLFITL